MRILGINAYHGDAAAALIENGRIVAAAAEERFSRQKHAGGIPRQAVAWCLTQATGPLDAVAIGRNPERHRLRKAATLLRFPTLLRHAVDRSGNAHLLRSVHDELQHQLPARPPIHYIEHHHAHLAHAYITAPSSHCALLSVDGFGDFVSAAWGEGREGKIRIAKRVFFPHSLGLLYTAISQLLGFERYGEEFKVMALASYGTPRFLESFGQLVRPTSRGFALAHEYFEHTRGGVPMSFGEGTPEIGRVFRPRLPELFGFRPRLREEPLLEHHADIAASLQRATEECVLHLAALVKKETTATTLALAGGVALNSVANGAIMRSGLFQHIWIPSAPADDGTAIGAAAVVSLTHGEGTPPLSTNMSAFLGPAYPEHHRQEVGNRRQPWKPEEQEQMPRIVECLERGGIVGWFEGSMEFGPRALGHRSILADPRSPWMREHLNAQVKHREAFRPFAPMVLSEDASLYFDLPQTSPMMMIVAPVRPEWRERLPAITHVDGSARIQTISAETHPRLSALLRLWKQRTGISVLLNTSFNENEPIVRTPEEARACVERASMDMLVREGIVVHERRVEERVR